MQKLAGCLAALLVTFLPTHASAYVACQGFVQAIEVRPSGEFSADYGFGMRLVCNLSGGNSACQAILAQFLSANSMRQKITSHHQNSSTCTQAFAPGTWWPADQAFAFTLQQ